MSKEKKRKKLYDEGEWFWSNSFVSPMNTRLIDELTSTYDVILDCIKTSNRNSIVTDLLSLGISQELLLKHLMLLLDTSAETLDRASMFISHKSITGLTLYDKKVNFKVLGPSFTRQLSNKVISKADSELTYDLILLMTYSAESEEFKNYFTFNSCILSSLAGDEVMLNEHIKYLSLRNNSQIKQLKAVHFGHEMEIFIRKNLADTLSRLGVSYAHDNRYNGQQFDTVLQKNDKFAIIEIAFQETTNSTLERKGKQAKNGLYKMIDNNNDRLIFVVDGAGYFRRKKALEDMIEYSHFVCPVSEIGLNQLISFLEEYFNN